MEYLKDFQLPIANVDFLNSDPYGLYIPFYTFIALISTKHFVKLFNQGTKEYVSKLQYNGKRDLVFADTLNFKG